MKKKKIVIATHGTLAQGFLSSLRIIIGDVSNVETICGYLTPDFHLENEIQRIMDDFQPTQEELLVFTDAFGGSINNGFLIYLKQYPFHLITNTNLGLLIDMLLTTEDISEDMIRMKVENKDFSTIYCNDVLRKMDENIDDL